MYRLSSFTFPLCWALFFFSGSQVSNAASIQLNTGKEYAVGPSLEHLVDANASLTIESLLSSPPYFQPPSGEVPSFGFTGDTYWFRVNITTNPSIPESWVLSHRWPATHRMDVFWVEDGQVTQRYTVGNHVPFSERPIPHRFFLSPLSIKPGTSGTLYLRIQSANGVQAPIWISPRSDFFQNDQTKFVLDGIFFGIVLVMVFYNLSVFFAFRAPNYLLYVIYIGVYGLIQAVFLGSAYQYLWPNFPGFQERSLGILIPFALMSGGIFVDRFLNMPKYLPMLSRYLRLCVGLALMSEILAWFIQPFVATALGAAIAIPTVTIAFWGGLQTWLAHHVKAAMYFVAAWAVFLIGVFVFALQKFGVIPFSQTSESLIEIGHALQVTLLSFALAERINEQRKATIAAQSLALEKEKEMAELQTTALENEKSISQDLEAALSKAEEAYRMKSEFLANISHELRTPLNAIVNVPTLILGTYKVRRFWHCTKCSNDFEDDELIPEQPPTYSEHCPDCDIDMGTETEVLDQGDTKSHYKLLNRGKTSGNYLLRIINDLLDISKLEAGKMLISPEITNVKEIFEEIHATMTDLATTKGITLKQEISAGIDEVFADPVKIGQILVNLVGNAIKFTEHGGVTFRVLPEPERDDVLLFEVQDTGIGIPESAQDLVFESFRQADGSHTRRHGGTGLGLAISKELVELHGGEIGLHSTEGVGTTFYFKLLRSEPEEGWCSDS